MMRNAIPAVLAASVLLGAAAPAPLLSHRAQYDVTLAPGASSGDLAGVRGRMVMEFRDACGGYTETQRFIADLTDVNEQTERTDYSSSTWESADGEKFNFDVSNSVVGKGGDRFQGQAQAPTDGAGHAQFSQPHASTLDLPKGTLFPTEFTEHVITAARAGQTNFSATVFEGDDATRLYTASAFIGGEETAADPEVADDAAMHGVRSWPVIVSYYPLGSDAAQPEYETSFRAYENGVATGMRMSYSNFSLTAHLTKLDVLPPGQESACDTSEIHLGKQ